MTAVDISRRALERYGRNNRLAVRVEQATIFHLPFKDEAFDGVFNLGVLEHFEPDDIRLALREFRRVLKRGGRLVVFWPHRWGSSVLSLRVVQAVLRLFGQKVRFHPDEVSLLTGRTVAKQTMAAAGLTLVEYSFGIRDCFVQAVVVAQKSADAPEVSGRSADHATGEKSLLTSG